MSEIAINRQSHYAGTGKSGNACLNRYTCDMPRCAFCLRTATLTGEHLWSEWMGDLLPQERYIFARQFAGEPMLQTWESKEMNAKAKVVCENCNNGWMSDLENEHAKPAMRNLILSDSPVRLGPERIYSITVFAYKAAVIGHLMQRNVSVFFPASVFTSRNLRRFADKLAIPSGIQVWVGCIGIEDPRNGVFRMRYSKTPSAAANGLKLYICTFGLGRFVLQIVASEWTNGRQRRLSFPMLTQNPVWNDYTFQVRPMPPRGLFVDWPPVQHISGDRMDEFSDRWKRIAVLGPEKRLPPPTKKLN
jgi:hypothetical protein